MGVMLAGAVEYNTKSSDGEAPFWELWGMLSASSLPLFPSPLWPGMVIPVKVLTMGQIELFNHLLYWKPFNCNK